jgi:hypothetical protein
MIRPNTPHPIVFDAVDFDTDPLTGATDLLLTIVDADTDSATFGHVWDWSTDAFTATPVQATAALEEVNATYVAGKYALTWPGAAAGIYAYTITQSPGVTVANVPATEVLQVRADSAPGDQMALTSGERTTVQALVLSDATPFQGARIDAAVSSRSSHAAADVWSVGTRTLTAIGASGIASQASVDALPSAATIGTAVWATAESTTAGTNGYAVSLMRKWITNQNYVDTTSSGRMRLFDDDASTVLLTWTLRDRDGNAITTPAGSPAQRGEAA